MVKRSHRCFLLGVLFGFFLRFVHQTFGWNWNSRVESGTVGSDTVSIEGHNKITDTISIMEEQVNKNKEKKED